MKVTIHEMSFFTKRDCKPYIDAVRHLRFVKSVFAWSRWSMCGYPPELIIGVSFDKDHFWVDIVGNSHSLGKFPPKEFAKCATEAYKRMKMEGKR